MLSAVHHHFDQENTLFSSGKAGGSSKLKSTAPSIMGDKKKASTTTRKALGEITNTPVRKPLSDVTNKHQSGSSQQQAVKKVAPVGVKVKKPKEKELKVNKVMDVEQMFPFKHTPTPDLDGFDFHADQFMVPVVIPYSLDYMPIESVDAPLSAEYLFTIPVDDDDHTELAITIDDSALTENLLLNSFVN